MSEITLINPNDLRTIVSDVVEEKLIALTEWLEKKLTDEERLFTPKEAMLYLSMSRSTFYRYVNRGIIPQYVLDNKSYYKKADINNALKKIN